jgi:hypothetical protein
VREIQNLNISMETKFESFSSHWERGGEMRGEFDTHIERNARPYIHLKLYPRSNKSELVKSKVVRV